MFGAHDHPEICDCDVDLQKMQLPIANSLVQIAVAIQNMLKKMVVVMVLRLRENCFHKVQ